MELFIRIANGQPFEHPIAKDNFRQAFPHIDPDNLPSNFARFTRVIQSELGVYQVYEGCTYEWDGDIVKDVHQVRAMTEEEKTTKQNEAKALWAENGYASWVFNEETCSFDPPTPYPDDGNSYSWDEETTSWVEVTDA